MVIWLNGNGGTLKLLILSQVVLNLQLPFAIIPLLHFTNDTQRMGVFASGWKLRLGGWATAVVVVGLNIWLAAQAISDWARGAGSWAPLVYTGSIAVCAALLGLLAWTLPRNRTAARLRIPATLGLEEASAELVAVPIYRRILVPLDHSNLDRLALSHAAGLAGRNGARLYLLHVEEGVTSQIYGDLASTAEVEAGRHYLDSVVESATERDGDRCRDRHPPRGPIHRRRLFAMRARCTPIYSSWARTATAASRI